MKIFWKENNLWSKATNIIKLYKKKFIIPKTIIIQKKEINNFNINLLKTNKQYLIRPSFNLEDWIKNSYAWFYKSLIFKNKVELNNFLLKNINNLEKKFWWENNILLSIIIQNFIKASIYWVYFTRNPNNIFQKWFYEIWKTNEEITSWNNKSNLKLTFLQIKELELVWKKIEKIFNYPQDIEFCIENNKIIILQTRNITTWNYANYDFYKINKINWVYKTIDFDELWEKQDYFSYKILKNLFNILYIDSKIYFKSSIIPCYLFKNIKTYNNNLNLFYKNYTKYLLKKILFNLLKKISFQKLDKNVLISLFKDYKYSFLLEKKSNLGINFKYKNTNFLTKNLLKLEKQKNISFKYLEKYKKEYWEKNFFWNNNYNLENKLIFLNWIIVNKKSKNNNLVEYKWVYKWKINWIITDLKNFKYKKNLKQILIIENLDFNLYDKINYIDWVIIKNWNLLSHNSIVLREYKIPSVIKYKNYNTLKIWDNIIL